MLTVPYARLTVPGNRFVCFSPDVKRFYSNPDVYQAIRCALWDTRMGVNPVLPQGVTGQLVTHQRPAAIQKIICITSHPPVSDSFESSGIEPELSKLSV